MVVEGEAGIGKTTFLLHVAEQSAAHGFRVLSTGGALTEARYAYAAVADLLDTVEPAIFADLPDVQRTALERGLRRCGWRRRCRRNGPVSGRHRWHSGPELVTLRDC